MSYYKKWNFFKNLKITRWTYIIFLPKERLQIEHSQRTHLDVEFLDHRVMVISVSQQILKSSGYVGLKQSPALTQMQFYSIKAL